MNKWCGQFKKYISAFFLFTWLCCMGQPKCSKFIVPVLSLLLKFTLLTIQRLLKVNHLLLIILANYPCNAKWQIIWSSFIAVLYFLRNIINLSKLAIRKMNIPQQIISDTLLHNKESVPHLLQSFIRQITSRDPKTYF